MKYINPRRGDSLRFTRRERLGLLALFFVMAVLFLLPAWLSYRATPAPPTTTNDWTAAMQALEDTSSINNDRTGQQSIYTDYDEPEKPYQSAGRLFAFDPNTLSEDGWHKLGLRPKIIKTILNYREKGGKFRKPEDLSRVYGLKQDEFDRLLPYISIKNTGEGQTSDGFAKNAKDLYHQKAYTLKIIDINLADTSEFISLPGIGSKLAARIVSFREKLGGFYSVEQVRETYGLPDSTFQKIKNRFTIANAVARKININTASLNDLKAHPYIRYEIGKLIIAYREQHGAFQHLDDLKKIVVINEDVFDKIKNYLVL